MRLFALALLLQAAYDNPREAFRKAESLYRDQRYAEAAEAYETMRAQGIEDGVLDYNLGNAYFKAGELGRAILNYERALKRMPGDEDVRANLDFANELLADEDDSPPLPAVIGWAVDLYDRLSPSLLAVVLSVVFLLGGVLVSLLLTEHGAGLRTAFLYTLAVLAVVALGSGAALAAKIVSARGRVEAIVLEDNAYVRSGPGNASPRLAEIHEGLKVRVVGEREGWLQVSLSNGLTGWLPADAIERI